LLPRRGRLLPGCDQVHVPQLLVDIRVEALAMIVVIGECRINLGERQVGVLPLDLLGIPVMSQSIEGNFHDLGASAPIRFRFTAVTASAASGL